MIVLYSLASLYLLWVMYLAVMSLARAREVGALSKPALILGYPLFAVGLAFDVLVNVVILSVVFLELPKEATFTGRVSRHCLNGTGWRKRLACWICHDFLDAFDPSGRHCK